MDNFLVVFGIVSGIASIVGLLLPAAGWKQRLIHLTYGILIAILSFFAVSYRSQLAVQSKMENQAAALLRSADANRNGNSRGFIFASLSFLEKYKSTMPDTYARAVQFAENSGVLINQQDDAVQRLHQSWSLIEAESAMKQLLAGVAGTNAAGQVKLRQ